MLGTVSERHAGVAFMTGRGQLWPVPFTSSTAHDQVWSRFQCMFHRRSDVTDWRRNQPIILHLRRWVPQAFPEVRRIGGYNNRRTRRGGFSAHSEGRAADIHLFANVPIEKRIGDGLFQMFQDYQQELGVDHVIWDRQIWSVAEGGPREYQGGSPHRDHVHVAFTRTGSQLQPSILIPLLDGLHIDLFGTLGGMRTP